MKTDIPEQYLECVRYLFQLGIDLPLNFKMSAPMHNARVYAKYLSEDPVHKRLVFRNLRQAPFVGTYEDSSIPGMIRLFCSFRIHYNQHRSDDVASEVLAMGESCAPIIPLNNFLEQEEARNVVNTWKKENKCSGESSFMHFEDWALDVGYCMIPQIKLYNQMIKEFIGWKIEERYSGKCGPERFLQWV